MDEIVDLRSDEDERWAFLKVRNAIHKIISKIRNALLTNKIISKNNRLACQAIS